ncbi:MAG: SDR family NAD(P)-dependent oxidoreductase [Burkholderiaceae bacterium]|jgi:sepiapterin reductase
MEVFIVTGTSRGLGAALAEELISPERRVICVARGPNRALEEKAQNASGWLDYYLQDLSQIEATDMLAQSICDELDEKALRLVLINNAGMVGPVAQASNLPSDELAMAFNLNVTAAMIFTSRFLKATETFSGARRIVNISSGAARNPYQGWSAYCATKAALDMFSRCVKLEQATQPNPALIVSLAPGVIDTEMQTQIRGQDQGDFPNVERFRAMKAGNQLAQASDVAKRILEFIGRADFGQNEIDDLRNHSSPSPPTAHS